ncbi:hypothetical protein MTO96_029899 [Rhipicephalus appendiculatus]
MWIYGVQCTVFSKRWRCGLTQEDMAAVHVSLLFIGLLYTEGVRHQIGFIVYHENTMREKCIATIQLPPTK